MPYTVNRSLNIPNTGDLPGAWGTSAINPNMSALDGQMGGAQTISLTNVNVTLTAGTGTVTPSAGPTQSDNAILKFTGTLTGNVVVTLAYPGFYIINNACTVGSFYVQVRGAGTGNVVAAPPGKPMHIANDGVDAFYVNMPDVTALQHMCVGTTPAWISACSVRPWLLCDGATHTVATYPALAAALSTTFGGNGVTTFGVPDLTNRAIVSIDTNSSGRLTTANSGINGTTLGAAGGTTAIQAHTHTGTIATAGEHTHAVFGGTNGGPSTSGLGSANAQNVSGTNNSGGNAYVTTLAASAQTAIQPGGTHTHAMTIATTGLGAAGNVQPTIVSGLWFIKS